MGATLCCDPGHVRDASAVEREEATTCCSSLATLLLPPTEQQLVLGKFLMDMSELSVVGEGSSSICRSGTNAATRERVAIKVYKHQAGDARVQLKKFRRQVAVLKRLAEPFRPPQDLSLWCPELERTQPSRVFMKLIDYSKDELGKPGPDPKDGVLYIVTELASYSLKDYLRMRREARKPLSRETTRTLAKAIMLVTAGLHAKGLVHLDLKPENLMIFNGKLKLIDVDGCVNIGAQLDISDSSLSFSPCYCSPEWASFMVKENEETVEAKPGMDVWSVGMTLCELATLQPVLSSTFAGFMSDNMSLREASFLFLEWLSRVERAPLPSSVRKQCDPELLELLAGHLLVPNVALRKTMAMAITHPFVRSASIARAKTGPLTAAGDEEHLLLESAPRGRRRQPSEKADMADMVVHKSTIAQLAEGGNPEDPAAWVRRDMWVAENGNLCYFNLQEGKREVLLGSHDFSAATLSPCSDACRKHAFVLRTHTDSDGGNSEGSTAVPLDEYVLSCDTQEDLDAWVHAHELLKDAARRPGRGRTPTMTLHLGPDVARELHSFRNRVNNRRTPTKGHRGDLEPRFKGLLWKCKTNGDPKKEKDWVQREMWISESGCLVYHSKREERDLIYYTQADLASCTLEEVPRGYFCKSWAFQVLRPASDGIDFAPGIFAAGSENLRDTWTEEIHKIIFESRKQQQGPP